MTCQSVSSLPTTWLPARDQPHLETCCMVLWRTHPSAPDGSLKPLGELCHPYLGLTALGIRSPVQTLAICSVTATATTWGSSAFYLIHYNHVHIIFRQPCWWDFMGEASDISVNHSLTVNSQFPYLFPALSVRIVFAYIGSRLHNSVLWLVQVFCNALHQLQRKVFLDKEWRHHLFMYSITTNLYNVVRDHVDLE